MEKSTCLVLGSVRKPSSEIQERIPHTPPEQKDRRTEGSLRERISEGLSTSPNPNEREFCRNPNESSSTLS